MRIALLEDEPLHGELVSHWLSEAGHECTHYFLGADFRHALRRNVFDLAILDWVLKDDDGLLVLTWLRKSVSASMPIMMVTARDDEQHIVQALDAGADDYLTKPVRKNELLARMRGLTRRSETATSPNLMGSLEYEHLKLDLAERRALVGGKPVPLSDKEICLAAYLLQNPGRLLTRRFLFERFWGVDAKSDSRTIDTHLSRLRAKLGLVPENGFELTNVYGKGYRLEVLKPVKTALMRN
jgi:two-component system, OmpR family, response regulator RegX3